MAYGGYRSTATTAATASTLELDKEVSSPPDDSISWLSFSPVANHLAVGSWDSKVRIYDVTSTTQTKGLAMIDFDGPVLGCDWSKDGRTVAGAGADKTAKLLDLGANGAPAQQIAVHDDTIKSIKFADMPGSMGQMVVTGSWDKTIRYWDMRTPTPLATLNLSERVYAMDVKDKLLVVAMAQKHLAVVDLNNPNKISKTLESSLKHMVRAVSCFKEADGFTIGGIEARCAFQYVEDKKQNKNMSFKCHRETPPTGNTVMCWPVNAISTHPIHGTISTAGSDGCFHFWDKESRSRLKGYPSAGAPISATAFNFDGTLFSYAVSYDWHKGYASHTPSHPIKVMLHACTDDDVKPKARRR